MEQPLSCLQRNQPRHAKPIEMGEISMNDLQRLRIVRVQDKLCDRFGRRMLHILSGQAMYEQLMSQRLTEKGVFAPFNEAMCSNETCEDIFGKPFNRLRAAGHQVTEEHYEVQTLAPLKPMLENKYDCTALWFGDDMFCQINLLTVLAYMDQTRYRGNVIFCMVNEVTYVVEDTEISPSGYTDVYRCVLLEHRMPVMRVPSVMRQGIARYLEVLNDDNEITRYIKSWSDIAPDVLLGRLFQRFPHYGLGDVQYKQMIAKVNL